MIEDPPEADLKVGSVPVFSMYRLWDEIVSARVSPLEFVSLSLHIVCLAFESIPIKSGVFVLSQ